MGWVLIVHDVDDYAAWKQVFDEAAGLRAAGGEREFQVLRDSATPNRVVHFSRWTSLDAARAFFQSPELEAIRAAAGVHPPQFLYLDEDDRGTLPVLPPS